MIDATTLDLRPNVAAPFSTAGVAIMSMLPAESARRRIALNVVTPMAAYDSDASCLAVGS